MERLIVDGYNVLHAEDRYASLARSDLDAARAKLVEDVASFASGRFRATVVFDGGGNPASTGAPHAVAGVSVLFSRAGQDADSAIEALVWRARERGETAVVATSDAETQRVVASLGMRRMSSAELVREMRVVADDTRAHSSAGTTRRRLEERIDPDLRDRLFKWARGE